MTTHEDGGTTGALPGNNDATAELPAEAGTIAYPPPETWPTGRLLSAAARRVERAWDAYLEQWGLTHASVPVLVVLAPGTLSQRQIAAQMHVTEQTIGRVVRNLEQAGHVTRERHASDRRRFVVAITPTGREALASLDDKNVTEALIGTSLTPAGVAELRTLLIQLVTDHPRPTAATDDQPPAAR